MLTPGPVVQNNQTGFPLRADVPGQVKPIRVDLRNRQFSTRGRPILCYICHKAKGTLQKDDKGYYHPGCKR